MSLKKMIRYMLAGTQERAHIKKVELKKSVRRAGLYLCGFKLSWPRDPAFVEARKRGTDVKGIPDPRCYGLQSAIRAVANVKGDVAECGVRFARSTLFLLTADQATRNYYLFDSWEGLPEPGEHDQPDDEGAKIWQKGDIKSEENRARENLAGFDNVQFMRGWIPDRFPEVEDRRFALVHVDVDLYEPTRDALAFFGERLSPGAVIVCDDYGSSSCPGARKACDEFVAAKDARLFESPTGQALIFDIPDPH